jgi:hypothetical protein
LFDLFILLGHTKQVLFVVFIYIVGIPQAGVFVVFVYIVGTPQAGAFVILLGHQAGAFVTLLSIYARPSPSTSLTKHVPAKAPAWRGMYLVRDVLREGCA